MVASRPARAIDVLVTIKNVGPVLAQHTTIDLTVPQSRDFRLSQSTLDFGPLKPDETKSARVNLFVARDTKADELPCRLFIRERGMNVTLDDTLKLAIDHRPAPQIIATNKLVSVHDASAKIHSGPAKKLRSSRPPPGSRPGRNRRTRRLVARTDFPKKPDGSPNATRVSLSSV